MNGLFERFVKDIVRQTDSNQEERLDLGEELLSHLQCSYEDLHQQGYSEQEAIEMAMMNFGDEKEVGKQLQKAMYPFRREMMLILAGASLILAYTVYLFQLFSRGDAHIVWLVLAVLVGVSIFIVTLHPIQLINRRLWMNGLLIGHIFIFFYGALLAGDLEFRYSGFLSLFTYAVVLLSVILVYRTTIYDFPSAKQSLEKDAKRVHFINITMGIVLIMLTLFALWAFLFVDMFHPFMLLVFLPIVLWMVSYAVQMRLLAAKRKLSVYAIAVLQLLVIAAVLGILFYGL